MARNMLPHRVMKGDRTHLAPAQKVLDNSDSTLYILDK